MADFRVVTDGSCDLSEAVIAENNISVVPFYVMLDGPDYQKQGVDVSNERFYRWMLDNPKKFPKSSAPAVEDYLELFRRSAEAGEKVICICITSKFSSSYQSATIACMLVREEYPKAEITVIDSMVNTVLQGMVVLEACRLRDEGATYGQAVGAIQRIRASGRIFFTIGGIEYLQKGGRIGKLAGKVSGALGIRPLITLSEGEIQFSGIVRGRPKSLDRVLTLAKNYITGTFPGNNDYNICVGYGAALDEAVAFREKTLEMLRERGGGVTVPIYRISSVIAVHTGPHPLGVGIVRRARV